VPTLLRLYADIEYTERPGQFHIKFNIRQSVGEVLQYIFTIPQHLQVGRRARSLGAELRSCWHAGPRRRPMLRAPAAPGRCAVAGAGGPWSRRCFIAPPTCVAYKMLLLSRFSSSSSGGPLAGVCCCLTSRLTGAPSAPPALQMWKQYAQTDVHDYQRSCNMLLNDSIYLLDESLKKLMELREWEVLVADRARCGAGACSVAGPGGWGAGAGSAARAASTAAANQHPPPCHRPADPSPAPTPTPPRRFSAMPPEERQEREGSQARSNDALKSYLYFAGGVVKTLHMSTTEVQQPFLEPEMVERVASGWPACAWQIDAWQAGGG
jgi:hypothetical protein